MDTSIKTQTQLAAVKQFNCSGCGNALEALNPRAQAVACPYCGSVVDVRSETHEILTALGKPERHPPFSFIRLGQTAEIEGRPYQVIARTRWRMTYKEYWSEEGETGYSDEVWLYDEWLLIDERRTYFYLVEDREGFSRSEEIVPETPTLLPKDLRMSFYKAQPRQIVREYGKAEAIHFEGESNYQIKLGDTIRFASMKDRGIDYLVEWRLNDTEDEVKEVEFFQETPVSRRKVLEAFSANPEIESIRQEEAKWRYIYRVALATCILLGLFLMRACTDGGDPVFQQDFDLRTITDTQGAISQPIEITQPGLFRLRMEATQIGQNTEMFVFGYILDAQQQAINTLPGEFYYYTGVDDEGRWTEADQESVLTFRLKEPGTYYVQLFRDISYTQPGVVRIGVYSGVMVTRYFIMALVLCGLVLLVAWAKKG
ncbi:MAG: hypothetical protein D6722_01320 [Bacteroidetes bacterium]|nr:MAG: hypothetical protein D6722_01320 [Bacteroidota bacterium]